MNATTTPNVVSVRGGKVHRGTPADTDAFPACRTGAQSGGHTFYQETSAPVSCKTCIQTTAPAPEAAEDTTAAPALVTNADPRAKAHYSDAPGTTRCGIPAPIALTEAEAGTRKVCFLCSSTPAPEAAAPAPTEELIIPEPTPAPSPDTLVTVRIAAALVPLISAGVPELADALAAAPVKKCGPGSMVHLTDTRARIRSYCDYLSSIVTAKAYGPGREKWRITRALRVANTDLDKALAAAA